MLNRLTFSVTFPTGKTFTGDHIFLPGMTAICAANEAGKSLRLEFIRYALFGMDALRGASADYKKSEVKLDFAVKGINYSVARTNNSKAELFREGEILASGIKPVNLKLVEIFGYGLKVFDTANAVNQGAIEALGEMKPAERKRMVDSVIGLTVIDDIAKWAGEEAAAIDRGCDTLESVVKAPVEVVKPEGYRPSAEVQVELTAARHLNDERNRLLGWFSRPVGAPAAVDPCPVKESKETLNALVLERNNKEQELRTLKAQFGRLDVPTMTAERIAEKAKAIESWQKYLKAKQFFLLHKRPAISMEVAVAGRDQHDLYHRWTQRRDLLRKGNHECPSCHHQWPVEAEGLKRFEGLPEVVEAPAHPLAYYVAQIAANTAWDAVAEQRAIHEPIYNAPVEDPGVTEDDLEDNRKALAQEKQRTDLKAQIEAIVIPADRSGDLKLVLQHEHAVAAYETALEKWKAWETEAAVKAKRLEELGEVEDLIKFLGIEIATATAYEIGLRNYEKAKTDYDHTRSLIAVDRAKAEGWRKARAALTAIRSRVKQHLVPSLNKVASYLLGQMTNGKRTEIFITEEFDVFVDGQPLATLSGSAKAVANLAIRIGLGQVLTNKVFSVLMVDEVDEGMDEERAESTAQALRALTKVIGQVIQVTHKRPEADNYIELEAA